MKKRLSDNPHVYLEEKIIKFTTKEVVYKVVTIIPEWIIAIRTLTPKKDKVIVSHLN